jgi:hypothetical protein
VLGASNIRQQFGRMRIDFNNWTTGTTWRLIELVTGIPGILGPVFCHCVDTVYGFVADTGSQSLCKMRDGSILSLRLLPTER